MLYPKFSQRYLAAVLLGLLFTIGVVAVSFLIYFNNEPLVLTAVHAKPAKQNEANVPVHLVANKLSASFDKLPGGPSKLIRNELNSSGTDRNKAYSVGAAAEYLSTKIEIPIDMQLRHTTTEGSISEYDSDISMPEQELQRADEEGTEQQNIYIDEYEKPNVPNKAGVASTRGKFSGKDGNFANSVLVTSKGRPLHQLQKKRNRLLIPGAKQEAEATIGETQWTEYKQPKLDQTHYKSSKKNYDNDFAAAENDDEDGVGDDGDLDEEDERNESNGSSGSGAYEFGLHREYGDTGYDDVTNDFIRRISLKMSQTYNHKYDNNNRNYNSNNSNNSKKMKGAHAAFNPTRQHLPVQVTKFKPKTKLRDQSGNTHALRKPLTQVNRNNASTELSRAQYQRYQAKAMSTIPLNTSRTATVQTSRRMLLPNGANINQIQSWSSPLPNVPAAAPATTAPAAELDPEWLGANEKIFRRFNSNRQQQLTMSPAWLETRTRRVIGNVKKSEERSRQLLLCEKEEAEGGELCRMLFKGHLND